MDNFEKSDVQHFISYLEGIINRLASNGANCKNWLLAIFAECMAMQPSIQATTEKIWLAYPLVFLFCLLDSYYLGCEKYFRDMMSDFVKEVRRDGNQYIKSLYKFEKRTVSDDFNAVLVGLSSIATWSFYAVIFAIVVMIDKGAISLM